jgi:hypothetical protein
MKRFGLFGEAVAGHWKMNKKDIADGMRFLDKQIQCKSMN